MGEIIKSSLEGIRSFTDSETAVGKVITTPSGVCVIPVSKISMGIATGGIDYGNKAHSGSQNFGGGGGTGLSITPIAFLTVGIDGKIDLIHIESGSGGVERITALIEHSPEIIEKIKSVLS